jgi:hypothetical protein
MNDFGDIFATIMQESLSPCSVFIKTFFADMPFLSVLACSD